MKNIISYFLLSVLFLTTSCSDWLDIQSKSEERESNMFETYNGFKEALAGCYTSMASRTLYGEKLMFTDIDVLARLYVAPKVGSKPALYYLHNHNYTAEESRNEFSAIFGALYNVIAEANTIITHIDTEGSVIKSTQARNVINAEAHAIRAFCHFDVLRLFGQMPQNAEKTVSLPYAEYTSITDMPVYYDFDAFVGKLENDLNLAESLLQASDPILEYTYAQLDGDDTSVSIPEDDFMCYRRERFNLWAVKALKARFYMYLGNKERAYQYAKEVINATINGKPVIELSGLSDLSDHIIATNKNIGKWYALPSECLFALNNSKLDDYATSILGGDPSFNIDTNNQLYVSTYMLNSQLYRGVSTASENRYLYTWEKTTTNGSTTYPTLKKYYRSQTNSVDLRTLRTKYQIMPLIRLSEMYLIAMESTSDLAEANALYKIYMESHNVNITTDFASLSAVDTEVLNEYRREFYGEGEIFYTYKRHATPTILFGSAMGENEYIIPLPDAEFDSNKEVEH